MMLNLCFNQFIKEIFYRPYIIAQILLVFLLINQQVFAENENISQDANLENLIDNKYNIYFSNSIVDGNISYNTFFQPKIKNSSENIWSGMLIAFFVDDNGNLREDSNSNLRLDSADAIINLSYDLDTNNIKVTRVSAYNNNFNFNDYSINDVVSVWSTDKSATMHSNISKLGYKEYATTSPEKRYIFTQISNNLEMLVNNACNLNYKYFNLDKASCYTLINYLYGNFDGSQRSKIKFTSKTDKKIINLGDIVHSEIAISGKPKANYDYLYQDVSYAEFKKAYQNRRKVIYVGANDGMLHAFNAGFYDLNNKEISIAGKNKEARYPLGSELWAYTPTNLLPHLKDLANKNYTHKFFVNGSLQIVDAQIFSNDKTHPKGWGTILIAATGLGGSFISLSTENNKKHFSSSYILLDVTNPEIPPKIITEINHENLGFTLSKPTVVRRKQPYSNNNIITQSSVNHNWYLVFASGPKNNSASTTDNFLKIFIFDLNNKSMVTGFYPKTTAFNNCYAGDMQSIDWDQTNEDSYIYFGALYANNYIVSNSSLLRIKLETPITKSTISTLATNLKPIVKAPLLVKDRYDFWVFTGSGRLLTRQDASNIDNQFLYGICEPLDEQGRLSLATVDTNKLIDVTNVEVLTNEDIRSKNDSLSMFYIDNNRITDFKQLEQTIRNRHGWKLNLDNNYGATPGCLQLQPQRVSSLILFPEFKPKKYNYFIGERYLHILHYKTGTASTRYQVSENNETDKKDLLTKKIYAGIGYSSSNYIKVTTSIKDGTKIIIPNAKGIKISADTNSKISDKSYNSDRLSWRKIK